MAKSIYFSDLDKKAPLVRQNKAPMLLGDSINSFELGLENKMRHPTMAHFIYNTLLCIRL